jgi:hypothetical protein
MKRIILVILVTLLIITLVAYSDAKAFAADSVVNPLTGLPVEDPDLLTYPPTLIPYARFTHNFKPSAGLSFAPWVFEVYAGAGESRPMALFYGSLPEATTGIVPYVGAITGALLGTEELRKQFTALQITTGNPQIVMDAGQMNLENWYGESGKDMFPDLPVSRLSGFLEKWKKRLLEPDLTALTIPFSSAIPANGMAGKSFFIRYADFNRVLWQFDETDGLYHRSQTMLTNPELSADIDVLNNQQLAVQNLIILFADHETVDEQGNFTVNFNYVNRNPALIFRDGLCYQAAWTTRNEAYEYETEKIRPFRFIYPATDSAFMLKPGKSWVHVVQVNNPISEVREAVSAELQPGSGNWRMPFISPSPFEQNDEELNPLP